MSHWQQLPLDMWQHIMMFLCNRPMKICVWVEQNINRLNWSLVCSNHRAGSFLRRAIRESNPLLDWKSMAANSALFPDILDMFSGSEAQKIDGLSVNPAAGEYLFKNKHFINWKLIGQNPDPGLFDRASPYNICDELYTVYERRVQKIGRIRSASNIPRWTDCLNNTAAIPLIREAVTTGFICYSTTNPITLCVPCSVEKKPKKINWVKMSSSMEIFEYDEKEWLKVCNDLAIKFYSSLVS